MNRLAHGRVSAFLLATALTCTGGLFAAPQANAAVGEIKGYLACPAGKYIGVTGWVNGQQTVTFYLGTKEVGRQNTKGVFTFETRTAQANWRVKGADLVSASDYYYKPSSGPASADI